MIQNKSRIFFLLIGFYTRAFVRWCFGFLLLVLCVQANAQFTLLNDISLYAGTQHGDYGNGISLYDINKDGYDDITICTKNEGVIIYLNYNLSFELYQPIPFIDGDLKHPIWVDYDNDNDPDFCVSSLSGVHLFNNENGNFVDVTDSLHLPDPVSLAYGMAWSDFDGDGWQDVYIANYEYFFPSSETNWLLKNNGQGAFYDVTSAMGCGDGQKASFQPVWLDLDHDRKPELFVVNDRYDGNTYFHNNGSSFSDSSFASGFYQEMEAMSNSWTDIDHNLKPDCYISNTTQGNQLLRFTDDGFLDTAPIDGLTVNSVCWNALWMDYNHDGWEDLHVATNSISINQNLNPIFRQTNNEFYPVVIQGDNKSVLCSAKGDLNNDGYWDYVEITQYPIGLRIFINDGGTRHWLKLALRGQQSCHDATGAEIHYFLNDDHRVRFTFCGEGFLSQDSQYEILSTADATVIDSLMIEWPSGWIDHFYNIQVDQFVAIQEGETFWYETISNHEFGICNGDSITVQLNSSDTITWFDQDTSSVKSFANPGSFPYLITNEMGFSFVDSVNIVLKDSPEFEIQTTNVSCFGFYDGKLNLTPFSPDWNITTIPQTESLITLSAGEYVIMVTDTNGCFRQEHFVIEQPLPLSAQVATDTICINEWTTLSWMIEGGISPYELADGAIFPESVPAGIFHYEIVDAMGCVVDANFEVHEFPAMSTAIEILNEEESVALIPIITNGTPPFSFLWNDFSVDSLLIVQNDGNYLVEVTDANGCIAEASVYYTHVDQITKQALMITPNPVLDQFFIQHYSGSYYIFNTYGEIVLSGTITNNQSIHVEHLTPGIYFFKTSFGNTPFCKQ